MSFREFGVCDEIASVLDDMGWKSPTEIQKRTLNQAIAGEDVSGSAETGSGKTGAYLVPLLQRLFDKGKPDKFGLILAPTRELVIQITEVAQKIAEKLDVLIVPIYGGVDDVDQMAQLAKRPHIVVATPGRIAQLIRDAKGFDLKPVQVIVIDEADKMAAVEFFDDISLITAKTAKQHQIMLFSATMPKNLEKFTSLYSKNASIVSIGSREKVPKSLKEAIVVVPQDKKEACLYYLLNEQKDSQFVVFVELCRDASILAMTLGKLGISVGSAYGSMSQFDREEQFQKFRESEIRVLVSTNVLGRGVDIPNIDVVINYDVPSTAKEYIHRSGRAGRASRAGLALTFVTKESKKQYQNLEKFLDRQLKTYKYDKDKVAQLVKEVDEAHEFAVEKYKKLSRGIKD